MLLIIITNYIMQILFDNFVKFFYIYTLWSLALCTSFKVDVVPHLRSSGALFVSEFL